MNKKTSLSSLTLSFITGIFLIASLNGTAQDSIVSLTLQETIEIAKQQSPDALKAKHRFRASYWEFRTYKASFMPMLGLDATIPDLSRSIEEIQLDDGSSRFRERSIASSSSELSLSKNIGLTGGQLFMKSRLKRIDFLNDSTPSSYLANPLVIGISQPVFAFNEFKWARKIDPVKYKEAQRIYLEQVEQISITATNYFFELLVAQIQKKIALVNLANYDTLYKIAKGRYNLGKIAENDLLQLELQFLRANVNVENAILDAENRLYRLKSYLRIQEDVLFELIIPDETYHFNIEVEKAIASAKEYRADALAFERRLLEAERDVSMAKMDNRFNANLYAEFGLTKTAEDIPDLYVNPLDQQVLNFGLHIPILDWGLARGRIKMAQSNQEIVKTSVDQEKVDFVEELFLEVMKFNMQEEQLKINAKADTVAAKGYEVTKARYLIGKIDITELNIAQTEKDNSTKSYINSLWSYWNNYYRIRKLTLYDFRDDKPISFKIEDVLL